MENSHYGNIIASKRVIISTTVRFYLQENDHFHTHWSNTGKLTYIYNILNTKTCIASINILVLELVIGGSGGIEQVLGKLF